MAAPHRYTIAAKNPGAHLYEVSVTVAEPDPAGQAFAVPSWIPGSYLIRDFAKHFVTVRAESEGEAVELTKTGKNSWQAQPCEAPLELTAEIYAHDPSVRGAHLDNTHAYFNGTCVFPAVVGQEDRECELEIAAPPGGNGWRVATSMQTAGAETYGFGTYRAADYAELIDHPVEIGNLSIGEFEAGGVPHVIAIRGNTRVDMARVCKDLKTLCEHHLAFLGRPQDLDRYVFLLDARDAGYGGLEHRWSSSLVCSRRELPRRGERGVGDGYRRFLGLCSHEYFHLWNVKRMRPARFTPYDLDRENYTGLLWVFEGITSYYDDLALARSGLITPESYLELLGRTVTRVLRGRGRLRQSVEESSFDAWIKFYQPDANATNAIVSYYKKGALIALALDLTLRHQTEGRCSLDDVMRECWHRYGETGEGMPERGLESVAQSVSGLDLGDFFERYVRGTSDLPLQQLLQSVGVQVRLRPASGNDDQGGEPMPADCVTPPWLGAKLTPNGTSSVFTVVHSDSPAERAGLSPGDEAVALDDLKLTAASLDLLLRDRHAGDKVVLTVFRGDELLRLQAKLAEPPEDTCYLTVDADAADDAGQRRSNWLNQ